MKTILHTGLALALASSAAMSRAHVSLQEPQAEAGAPYRAVLRISHGCEHAGTTAVTVRVPAGFENPAAQPKAGWTVSMQPGAVTWSAATKEAVLPATQKSEFVLAGKLPRDPGPLWFKVLQTCEQGSMDWSQMPASGVSTAGLKTPAVLLEVLSPRDLAQARVPLNVDGAWVRSTVPGQPGTGAFMQLTAKEPMELVGASTPVAGQADVHQMTLEGDVMRMRPIGRLELPAGQTRELKPGGYHIMLQELKQPLATGSTVPLTLLLRDARGVASKLELKLPVLAQPPGAPAGAAAAPTEGHKH